MANPAPIADLIARVLRGGPDVVADPHPLDARVREHARAARVPVMGPVPAVHLARYEDVHAAVRDPRLSSERDLGGGAPEPLADPSPEERAGELANERVQGPSLLTTDPPAHTRLRGLVQRAFSPRIVGGHGVANAARLDAYLREIVARRRAEARDDLVSALVRARDEDDALSEDDIVAQCTILLVGGHETTTAALGSALALLDGRPDLWAAMRERPELVRLAVIACGIAYCTPIPGQPRRARAVRAALRGRACRTRRRRAALRRRLRELGAARAGRPGRARPGPAGHRHEPPRPDAARDEVGADAAQDGRAAGPGRVIVSGAP